jgi:hypothetical protein
MTAAAMSRNYCAEEREIDIGGLWAIDKAGS